MLTFSSIEVLLVFLVLRLVVGATLALQCRAGRDESAEQFVVLVLERSFLDESIE